MNPLEPFTAANLAELDMLLLDRASEVVAMEDVHDGNHDPRAIALRHDVDAGHALSTAVRIAEWEAERGYRSTFYVLHTSPYWGVAGFADKLHTIAEFGHEIGIHANAIAEALRTGGDPDVILGDAIKELRDLGFQIRGVAGHGDSICARDRQPDEGTFANDEQFVECRRPKEGEPDRVISRGDVSLQLAPRPLSDFGLEYEALRVAFPWPFRVSDSGGRWVNPGWEETVDRWTQDRERAPRNEVADSQIRQLHLLWHPDWWRQAFRKTAVPA